MCEFSVVVPAYNAENTIRCAIDSILNQSFSDFEIICVDDCSIDDTYNLLIQYNDSRLKVFRNDVNMGVAESRNKAISEAKGRYIAFLDSDDYWYMDKLFIQYSALKKGYPVVFSSYHRQDEMGGKLKAVEVAQLITYEDMLKCNHIGNLTGAYDCYAVGKVYQKPIGHEDYLMWLNILKKTDLAYAVKEPLAMYTVRSHSLSSNKIKSAVWTWNIYYNELNLGFARSTYCFLFYVFKSIRKFF